MEDENPKYSYTFRSLNIAATSCFLAIFLIFCCFILVWELPIYLQTALIVVVFMLCCSIGYFSASGIAFYFREIFQKYVPAWLIISFFGSAIFVFTIELIFYLIALERIKVYKKSTSMFSTSSPPVLPTFDEFAGYFLISTLILSVITGLASSVSSLIASRISEEKAEKAYTFLKP